MQQSNNASQAKTRNGNGVLLSVALGDTTTTATSEEGMSTQEKQILASIQAPAPLLPYPLQELKMRWGPAAQEYIIPEEEREKVLKSIYPFQPCPDINATRFDLHEEKFFLVRDFKAVS